MKRVLAGFLSAILLLVLLCGNALAATTSEVCTEIARQFQESFKGNSTFVAKSYFDESLNAILLSITAKSQDASFFKQKRTDNDIDAFYDMLAELNVYSAAKANLDKHSITGVDVYVLFYSSDGILQYLEINGNNITEMVSIGETPMLSDNKNIIVNGIIQQNVSETYGRNRYFDYYGVFLDKSNSVIYMRVGKEKGVNEKFFKELGWYALVNDAKRDYTDIKAMLVEQGYDDVKVFVGTLDAQGSCFFVYSGMDATTDENKASIERLYDYVCGLSAYH